MTIHLFPRFSDSYLAALPAMSGAIFIGAILHEDGAHFSYFLKYMIEFIPAAHWSLYQYVRPQLSCVLYFEIFSHHLFTN